MPKYFYTARHFSLRRDLRTAVVIVLCSLLPVFALAHPGAYDKQGGHFDHKTGHYHCHTDTCFQQHQQSQQALQEATRQQRPFSKIYKREDWPHWSDLDNDCQDTRAEILISASKIPVAFNRHNRCYKVISGQWLDPYTHKVFYNADQLDIDHRIALAEAHRYGGASWTTTQKEAFANDPLNLVPVQAEANHAKGSHPAYEWMPKDLGYWCAYIQAREAVVAKYHLVFPQQEIAFNQKITRQYCY